MSVDPWAHETMQQYQFTNSNPIKYIDPDGRDVWEIDEKGNIVSHTIDKTKDAFYRVDASGNRLEGENNSIEFTYGTIKSQNSPNVRVIQKDGTFENRTLTLYDVNGDDNAKELFEFMANNNKVEFTHAKIGGKDSGRNIVGTSHNKSSTPVGQYLRKTGYTLREVNHNHPSDNPIPSGYPGDRSGAELYKKQFPNVKLHIYTVKHGYSEYDEKGTLDERILTGKI